MLGPIADLDTVGRYGSVYFPIAVMIIIATILL